MVNRQDPPRRLVRERQTIAAMVGLYCRGHHSPPDGLCVACRALLDYAMARLDHCPFGARKPTCAKCPVHCYQQAMREKVKDVMRYAGPRMLLRHPILSLLHQLDALRGRRERASRGGVR